MIVLAQSQHQGGERAAQAQAEAAAHPLVSCKAPFMCRPDALKPSITFRALLYRVPSLFPCHFWHYKIWPSALHWTHIEQIGGEHK